MKNGSKLRQLVPLAWLAVLAPLTDQVAHGHELTMTTAEVSLRQDVHLTVTVRASVVDLFHHLDWEDKPATLVHLVGGGDDAIETFRQAIAAVFARSLKVVVDGRAIVQQRIDLADVETLTRQTHMEIARTFIAESRQAAIDLSAEADFIAVQVQGLIAPRSNSLVISFPVELGDVLVTYTEPQAQTLSAGGDGAIYRRAL